MRTRTARIAGVTFAAAGAMALTVGPAFAANGTWVSGNLSPVANNNVSAVSGTAMAEVNGDMVTVTVAASGLLAGSPHAAHIHFAPDARHACPTIADDKNGDGHVNTSEGVPAYGSVMVSLTTSGDTSPKSALAIDRFSTAPGGKISYERGNIKVTPELAKAISDGQAAIVVHGVDYNKNGKYDGATKSDLDPSLPTEATDPALCGILKVAPAGSMHTGGGGAAAGSNEGMLLLGGGLLLGALGTGAYAKRRTNAVKA
ncbi:MAG: CHRD domain-containing protein [Terracoccus sp.]